MLEPAFKPYRKASIPQQISPNDVQDGVFQAVVPGQPKRNSTEMDRTIEYHCKSQGCSMPSLSCYSHHKHNCHWHQQGHCLSRSHLRLLLPRLPEHVPRRGGVPCSQFTVQNPPIPLSPPSSKRHLEKKPLACFFCHGRKIACRPPKPGSPNKTCK